MKFSVTFDIVTDESAEYGDAEERGFISQDVSLRQAIEDLFETRTSQVDQVEAIQDYGSSIAVFNGMEYLTGARESRTLHPSRRITYSSFKRICRLVGAT